MHLLTEHYLQNEPLPKAKVPISQILFNIAKPELDKIDNILVQEKQCIACVLVLLVHLTVLLNTMGSLQSLTQNIKVPQARKWIDGYFVQASAYACMLYELTGIKAVPGNYYGL